MRLLPIFLLVMWTIACEESGPRPPTSPTPAAQVPPAVGGATAVDLSGTVVEIGAGPVEGATVSARNCESNQQVLGQAQTDATGAFRLTIDAATSATTRCMGLSAQKVGYLPTDSFQAGTPPITIRMQRLRRATGRVLEVDGGPLQRVKLSTAGQAGTATATDENGFFILNGVGRWFDLEKTGFVTRQIQVPEGQDIDLQTIHLQRTMQVSAGSRVTSRISSSDGYYDSFTMWDEGVFCSPCKAIEIETGQQDLDVELHWTGGSPLTLWTVYGYWNSTRTAPASPDVFNLRWRAPADTFILLVGVRSNTFAAQSIPEPVYFDLSIKVPPPVSSATPISSPGR